ncbi:hypothetical protein GCM10009558_060250 [Virgisporangium aurantiacum]
MQRVGDLAVAAAVGQQAHYDPTGYVHALALASAAAELTDPEGLGGHWWVVQPLDLSLSVCQSVIPAVFSSA